MTAVPTLDELPADPKRANDLPAGLVHVLSWECLDTPSQPDSLFDVPTAAARLGVSRD